MEKQEFPREEFSLVSFSPGPVLGPLSPVAFFFFFLLPTFLNLKSMGVGMNSKEG